MADLNLPKGLVVQGHTNLKDFVEVDKLALTDYLLSIKNINTGAGGKVNLQNLIRSINSTSDKNLIVQGDDGKLLVSTKLFKTINDVSILGSGDVFTPSQKEAINSGVTTNTISQVNSLETRMTTAEGNIDKKQDILISGTNIKTINSNSIIGSGDVEITSAVTWGNITGTVSNQTDLVAGSPLSLTDTGIKLNYSSNGGLGLNNDQLSVQCDDIRTTIGSYAYDSSTHTWGNKTQSNNITVIPTVMDGQWVNKTQILSSDTNIGVYTLDLSEYLPNDNYIYEVELFGHVRCDNSNPATFIINDTYSITTKISIGSLQQIYLTIPVLPTDRTIKKEIQKVKCTSTVLTAIRYRRIGTNE